MNNLPGHNFLPISNLARVFNNTSATYKYYWFLAMIDCVEENQNEIDKEKLFIKMMSIPWYTVNYFHVSFGSQDLIQQTIDELIKITGLSISEKKSTIESKLKVTTNSHIKKLIYHFDKNVPHWFLSPWYPGSTRNEIYALSKEIVNTPIYSLYSDKIIINDGWFDYLQRHSKILKNFCYWNLSLFLQVRNPNVPDIPNKLIRPAKRNSLKQQRNNYWSKYLRIRKNVTCIFTGKLLTEYNYALDHFIPFAFVSHDLLWNLIPIDSSFNSSKSDRLPSLDQHFDSFFDLQKDAFITLSQTGNIKKFKEDYFTIFPILNNEGDFDKVKFKNVISPLISIAENNGFQHLAYES